MVAVATTVAEVITEPTHKPLREKSSASRAKARSSRSGSQSKAKTSSPSPKSDSDSKQHHNKYRLRKTLRRKPSFHELNEHDIKYLWAAYKLGSFGEVKPITTDQFKANLAYYLGHFDVAYCLEANTKKGKIPVGVVGGRFVGPLLFMGSMTWFPWASKRNIYESVVNTLNELRKDYLILLHSNMSDKDFYVNVARHGILRRVGTVHDVYEDGPAALFETRKPV